MIMKTCLFFVFALFFSLSLKAQDTLVLKSGESMVVRIDQVSDSYISFARWNEKGKLIRSKVPRYVVSEIHWRSHEADQTFERKPVDWSNKPGFLIGIPFSSQINGLGVGIGFSNSFNRHMIKLQGELVNGKKSKGPIRDIPQREDSYNGRLTYGYNLAYKDIRFVISSGIAYLSRQEKGELIDEHIYCPELSWGDVFMEIFTLGLYNSGECTGTRTYESINYDTFGVPLELNLGIPLDKRHATSLEFQLHVIFSPEITTTGGGIFLHF
jgi:hypothetical protein